MVINNFKLCYKKASQEIGTLFCWEHSSRISQVTSFANAIKAMRRIPTLKSLYSKSVYSKYFFRIVLNAVKRGSQLLRISASEVPAINCCINVALPASLLKK